MRSNSFSIYLVRSLFICIHLIVQLCTSQEYLTNTLLTYSTYIYISCSPSNFLFFIFLAAWDLSPSAVVSTSSSVRVWGYLLFLSSPVLFLHTRTSYMSHVCRLLCFHGTQHKELSVDWAPSNRVFLYITSPKSNILLQFFHSFLLLLMIFPFVIYIWSFRQLLQSFYFVIIDNCKFIITQMMPLFQLFAFFRRFLYGDPCSCLHNSVRFTQHSTYACR
jgi:hypothetical protein